MYFKDILGLSTFNVRRGKSRTILTMLSVCVGVASVMLITTLGDSGSTLVFREIEKMGVSGITVFSKNDNVFLEENHVDDIIKNVPIATDVQPLIIESGRYRIKNWQGSAIIWGVDANVQNVISLELLHGRLPNKADITQKKKVAVVDTELANNMYHRTNIVGKEVVLTVSNHTEKFTIIGVVSSQKDGLNQMLGGTIPHFIYVPYKTLGMLRGSDSVSQIAIKCDSTIENDRTGDLAVETLSRITGQKNCFGYENINAHIVRFKKLSEIVTLLISVIAAISLIVAGLGIMNTMLASTAERKKEIGTLMALGARRSDIAFCFIVESTIISGIGGISGAIIGIALSFVITKFNGMPTIFNLNKIITIIMIAVSCGVVFSLSPAYRASRLDPVQTLHE